MDIFRRATVLKEPTLEDKSSSGKVVVHRVKGPMSNPPAWCHVGGDWQIHLTTGELPAQGFLHEFAHGWYGMHDEEYNCINRDAGVCLRSMLVGGTGEGFFKFCDESNCKQGPVCWPRILESIKPEWKHPGPGGTMPTCNVEVTNH